MINFERVYLDTSVLYESQWPRLSARLSTFFTLAENNDIDVVIPEAVEIERQQQWMRELREIHSWAVRAERNMSKHARGISVMSYSVPRMDEESLIKDYSQQANLLKHSWSIGSAPLSMRPLFELFGMAVLREAPFEDGEGGVVGFQDAVILFSVIDHLLSTGKPPSAFVSSDKVFGKCRPLIEANGVELQAYAGLKDVLIGLQVELSQQILEWWQRDKEEVQRTLNDARNDIGEFIRANLPPSVIGSTWHGRVVAIDAVDVTNIGSVDTPLLKDIYARTLAREDGAVVKCTAQVEANLQVKVEQRSSLVSLFDNFLAAKEGLPIRAAPPPRLESDSISRTLEVDADAVWRSGTYTIASFNGVRAR